MKKQKLKIIQKKRKLQIWVRLFLIFFRLKFKAQIYCTLVPNAIPCPSLQSRKNAAHASTSAQWRWFVQVNSFVVALQAGFTACTKAAGCPGHKAFTRLAFFQPHSARLMCTLKWLLHSAKHRLKAELCSSKEIRHGYKRAILCYTRFLVCNFHINRVSSYFKGKLFKICRKKQI